MSRTPQPMRRMVYVIREVMRSLTADEMPLGAFPEAVEWLEGGSGLDTFILELRPSLEGVWRLVLKLNSSDHVKMLEMSLIGPTGPETVLIGPTLIRLTLPDRSAEAREVLGLPADT